MTGKKLSALRHFLLPCLSPSPSATSSSATHTSNKKRLSTSLRDDIITPSRLHSDSDSSPPDSPPPPSLSSLVPPRPSRTMVTGTVFGHRRGPHVWFCVQPDRTSLRPSLLLQIPLPTQLLVKEIRCGLVRIALQTPPDSQNPLRSTPTWSASCNGRPLGFASRKKPTQAHRALLSGLKSITVGAGVVPNGPGPNGLGPNRSGLNGSGEGELMYMRASYECIVGGPDSESFHLISPDQCPGQELSIFLLRSR